MLKTSNLLKFFFILSPLLIHATGEKKETTPNGEEIVKQERINFLNEKIILEEKLLKDLEKEQKKVDLKDAASLNEKIKIKETDILNAKNELAALNSSKNTFCKNVKDKLNTCKEKISNRTYIVLFGKTVSVLALVAGIGYAIKTYIEKKNTPAE